ncbi:MAG: DUF2779 domain-containing protein [Pyrinomonadaceae bacterium]|nr:DUF2779 domain-containing protein [Pyrinomonadaceae bacterium]
MKLTKSKFRRFADCKNEFWLDHHFPEQAEPDSLEYQLRRETGYEVERLARTLPIFADPDGTRVAFGKDFETDTLFAKADIIVTDPETGDIEIYEVKSGTKAKDDYKIDLAFQCFVAERSGYTVRNAYLIFINSQYLFDGELDVGLLLTVSDETESVRELRSMIESETANAIAWLAQDEPIVELLDYCGEKLDCKAIRKAFADIPEFNVSHIFNAHSKKLDGLLSQGIIRITDIPADFAMTDRESAKVNVERTGNVYLERDSIKEVIQGLNYPLHFLDYESFNPAVPKFVNTRPYQQMVFQYSLHTIEKEGSELKHSFHLSRNDGRHPSEEIVERLYEDLNGRFGTVIIWSEGFEKTRNKELGEMFPDYAAFLEEVNAAVYDIRKIFSKQLYMHPRFRGRDSIKVVLPVLSDLTYEGMAIADGLTASIKWYHAATGRGTPEEREKTFQDLEAYCHLDTLAMVRIYEHLLTI